MKPLNLLTTIFFMFLCTRLAIADDAKILLEVEIEIRKAKNELLKWDKTHKESDLDSAIDILKNARTAIAGVANLETRNFLELNKELAMLYFWANKSKRVFDVGKDKKDFDKYKKSVEEVVKEELQDIAVTSEIKVAITKESSKILESILSAKISVEEIIIPDEHPLITSAFKKAIEFSKNNQNQLYECEFMFRDIFYDFPTSKSAKLANEIANKYSEKIENFVKEKYSFRNSVIAKIPNYTNEYNSRNFDSILATLTEMKNKENDVIKLDIYWEMIEEFKYLQTAIEALNDLISLKKNQQAPADMVGVNFRGFVTGSDKKGIQITTEMGGLAIPWVKVSDDQLGKLLAFLSKGIEVSYKIPIAIHLLGNTQEAFQILYQRALDNPTIMVKYSRFYFQTLFYFRKQMATQVDKQIETAQKLFNNKDTSGAIGVLTQSLLNINKINFLRDQISKIHTTMATFNK
jgi:hypothetical protein